MATRVEIVAGGRDYAEELARNIRENDAIEVMASGGFQPLDAVKGAIEFSTACWTVLFDGEVAAIWGVGPYELMKHLGLNELGVAWLLTSNLVTKHPKTFLKLSRELLPTLLKHFPVLFNMVDARYKAALRWAARIGFEVRPPIAFGAEQLPFHPIVLRRPHV